MRYMVIVKASVDIDGTNVSINDDGGEADVWMEKLPLELKLQEGMDQKLRMQLAKKIRLRKETTSGKEAIEEEMATFQNEQTQECMMIF